MTRVLLAMHGAVVAVDAIVHGGLCIRALQRGLYQLAHVNSGLKVGPAIRATKADAEALMHEVAALADWTAFEFDFENISPDLPERVSQLFQARGERYEFQPRSKWTPEALASMRAQASAVREAREQEARR